MCCGHCYLFFVALSCPHVALFTGLILLHLVYVVIICLGFLPFRTSPSGRKLQLLSSDSFGRCRSARSGLQTRGLLHHGAKCPSGVCNSLHSTACFAVYFPDLNHCHGGHASAAGHVPNT